MMSTKPLLWVIGAGLVIGVLWPGKEEAAIAPVATDPARAMAKAPQSKAEPLEVVLERKQDGHFYADVDVNGRTIRFLIDTGATAIALTADDARSLGFGWTDAELEPVGRGVSGPVNGKLVELHHVKLGGKEAWNMRAAIIPGELEVSLLGQSFLSQIGSVRISGDQMVLR